MKPQREFYIHVGKKRIRQIVEVVDTDDRHKIVVKNGYDSGYYLYDKNNSLSLVYHGGFSLEGIFREQTWGSRNLENMLYDARHKQ